MAKFLSPRTRGSTCAIAYCDRCHKKKHYDDLSPDRNSPGLRVCDKCNDELDPYRKPARRTEDISLKFARPDRVMTLNTDSVLATEYGEPILFGNTEVSV